MDLTDRQQHILRIVVREYINSGLPIGSKTLVETHDLSVSAATVRNEMAYLEEAGYLIQPHTSSGRMPTEQGYRYFVENLMGETQLSAPEKLMIEHQFHQARQELDQWMRLSAAVLAHTTQTASLVTSPKVTSCQLKHLELISINDHVVLFILVLKEGTVKQQILTLDKPYTQDKLRTISRQLTDLWFEQDVRQIEVATSTLLGLAAQVSQVVISTMNRINARKSSDMYHAGLTHVMSEIDLAQGEVIQQVIRVLEERQIVEHLVSQIWQQNGVQIIIGGEGQWDHLSQVSIILSQYGTEGISGALGVVGPVRMPYGRAVSIVRFMSNLMSDLLTDLYGSNRS